MRVEVTIARTTQLPAGAIDALTQELSKRIDRAFPEMDHHISVRYAGANNLTVMGSGKETKDRVSEILQETWESADDWFSAS
ncbi:DNA damage-inducible protein I [Mixta tenebrionis]|uniref:DNA damage-inducible protein I n=1 Tax=Mixta tenebrionis TaxID=2562439 RepID=A0A506VG06_9GAMM|nr:MULTISPECIES: DNA damage-inducible protein I [Mixta]QHM75937.1 DNA damage-inducible protein I [Mixta theicola]TPW44462.1 DNA damage-inducible protein I [Mixta tenebrionis]